MSNRWFRFVIALLALVAAAAAGFRIYQQEQVLSRSAAAHRTAGHGAEAANVTLSEIKAALHGIVAPGQGHAFWTGRARTLIDSLRTAVLELDATAAAAGASLTEALNLTDRLAAVEQRARAHVVAGETLMAGEVVFTEARDVLEALRRQIATARDRMANVADARHNAIRAEQLRLTIAGAAILSLAVLLLMAPTRRADATATPGDAADASEDTVGYGPGVRTLGLSRNAPDPTAASASARAESQASYGETAPVAPSAPAAPALFDAATLCTDLARLADANELSGLLERASDVLGASGIIIWLSSPDRRQLLPAASTGFDPRLLRQLKAIPPDAANLTAAAFREQAPRAARALATSSAALATPLLGPDGAVGVLSAELKDVSEVSQTQVALAAIIAAQLATLLGTMTAAEAAPKSAVRT